MASDLPRTGPPQEIMVSAPSFYLRLTKSEKAPVKPPFPPSLRGTQIGVALSGRWESYGSHGNRADVRVRDTTILSVTVAFWHWVDRSSYGLSGQPRKYPVALPLEM